MGLVALSLGCSTLRLAPVRPSLFSAPPPALQEEVRPSERFRDTLVLPTPEQPSQAAANVYADALRLFESGDYRRAAALFSQLARSAETPDSLAAEALFYAGECIAAVGQLHDAQTYYERLLRRLAVAPSLRERTLLRLGHVLCAQGQSSQAEELFAQLRHEFPHSRYLPLANCAAVQQSAPER